MANLNAVSDDEPLKVTIESLLLDGRGVGHIDGKAVFVAGALPGETVTIKFARRKRKFDEALVDEVLDPSPLRVEPQCSIFGTCGGCSLQHMDAEAQITEKQKILLDNLERLGQCQPETVLEPLTATSWGYRQKARMSVRNVIKKGKVLVGFREKKSRYVADMQSCEVLDPRVGHRIGELGELIQSLEIASDVPQIEVAINENQVALVLRIMREPSDADIEKLRAYVAENDLLMYFQRKGPDKLDPLSDEPPFLHYELPDYDVKIAYTPTDFTQVNGIINQKMIQRALGLLAPNENDQILELFCGLGNFSLPIARQAGSVVGVEGAEALVSRARDNAALNQIDNVEFYAADLTADASQEKWFSQSYNKVFLDPPRTGALEVMPWLIKLKPEIIVYVSCNPATLARDAGMLVEQGGYRLHSAGVMDMFPHTAHVESIAYFVR